MIIFLVVYFHFSQWITSNYSQTFLKQYKSNFHLQINLIYLHELHFSVIFRIKLHYLILFRYFYCHICFYLKFLLKYYYHFIDFFLHKLNHLVLIKYFIFLPIKIYQVLFFLNRLHYQNVKFKVYNIIIMNLLMYLLFII